LSTSFPSIDVALANCPAKQSICGTKAINVDGFASPPVELAVTKLNSVKDSCHWMIKATCDIPEIALKPTFKPALANGVYTVPFTMAFTEYSTRFFGTDSATKLDGGYPLAGVTPVFIDDFKSFFPGSLPDVMLKNNASVAYKYPAYLIENDIRDKLNAYKDYNASIEKYNSDVDTWNIAMTKVAKYNTDLANHTATVGFFDCLLGCAFPEEPPKIPKKPVKPVKPLPYKGQLGANFTYIEGYGVPTSGTLYPFSGTTLSALNQKYFGVLGQGFLSGFGYDQYKDEEKADGILDCSNRYIHLSLLPNALTTADLTGAVGTVRATRETARDLSAPYIPADPIDFKAEVLLEGGAATLAVSSAMALLAAISLY
jgi:hypothetical protein